MKDRQELTPEEIDLWAHRFEHERPEELLVWATKRYVTDIILASSFGAEDVVLIDMLQNIAPKTPIFYLDTNKHFPETYETRDRLVERYGIRFIQVLPKLSLEEQAKLYGDNLWSKNPTLCCNLRKVEPLAEILSRHRAWITGIRRDQAPTRANAKKIEWDGKFGLVKCNPLASWKWDDIWHYIRVHDVPYNPLHDQYYPSIGCSVCTTQVLPGKDPRAGRWAGFNKTECGLHK